MVSKHIISVIFFHDIYNTADDVDDLYMYNSSYSSRKVACKERVYMWTVIKSRYIQEIMTILLNSQYINQTGQRPISPIVVLE